MLHTFSGLNKKMHFPKFTAYFNQPLSTTPSKKVAQEFADVSGIILSLKSATGEGVEPPKYLSVKWLSDFPSMYKINLYLVHNVDVDMTIFR